MKVILVGQYFHPEFSGTAQVLTDLAIGLGSRGMDVEVITGQPTYQRSSWLPHREQYAGVDIERLPLPYLGRTTIAGRAASAFLFLLISLLRLIFSRTPSILLIVTNPPILPLAGWVLKKLRRQKYVCLVQDLYPDIPVRLGYLTDGSLVTRLWEKMNERVYRDADVIVVLGTRMAERMREKLKFPSNGRHLAVIHNWADPDFIVPLNKEDNWFSREQGLTGKLVVQYSGNIGLFHDVETILEAAKRMRSEERILFLFIGAGGKQQKVSEFIRLWDLRNVRMLPYQPWEYLPYSLTCGDISAVTLTKGLEGLCVPGKLYTSLAAGQAILAVVGQHCEVAEIIEECGCGFRVDQGDVEGAVEALKRWSREPQLLAQMKRNARRCFEERFTRTKAVQEYYFILNGLMTT